MTELPLPSTLTYGYVVGQFMPVGTDTADEDRLPSGVSASGSVTFAPATRIIRSTGMNPVTILLKNVTCTLDSTGRILDSQGALGVVLVAGYYKVTYDIAGHAVPSHDIHVTAEHTESSPLDVTEAIPLPAPTPTTSYVRGASAYETALTNGFVGTEAEWLASLEGSPGPEGPNGVDRAPVTVLTNPTAIPTEPAGRLDLVFTEPTTVAFDVPGRTDLVLAIDGWDFITWSGAVVHGAPDATKTVWASAMWRDLDSSWHVLAVQENLDTGGSAGQGLERVETTYDLWKLVEGPRDTDGFITYTHNKTTDTSVDFVTNYVDEDAQEVTAIPVLAGESKMTKYTYLGYEIEYDHISDAATPIGWKMWANIYVAGPVVKITGYMIICPDHGMEGSWGGYEMPAPMDALVMPAGGNFTWDANVELPVPGTTREWTLDFYRYDNESYPGGGFYFTWWAASDGTATVPPRTGESGAPPGITVPDGAHYIPFETTEYASRTGISVPLS